MTVLAVAERQLMADRGEVARYHHAATLPCLEVSLRAAGEHGGYPVQRAHARVSVHPVGSVDGITNPAELDAMADMFRDAAAWLRAQPEPDGQLSLIEETP